MIAQPDLDKIAGHYAGILQVLGVDLDSEAILKESRWLYLAITGNLSSGCS
jgi:hypothetical protein